MTVNEYFKPLQEEIWKRYGNFELSHDKNQAVVDNITRFLEEKATEFARYQITKALKAATEQAKINVIPTDEEQWEIVPEIITSKDIEDNEGIMLEIDKDSILNAYKI